MKRRLIAASLLVLVCSLCGAGCGASEAPRGTVVDSTLLSGPVPFRGISLAGADFGADAWGNGALPGTHGVDYVYPDPAYASGYNTANYYVSKGMTAFRLPFRWERLQTSLNSALNSTELSRLTTTVNNLTAKGVFVILDPHNYARYRTALVGTSTVSNAQFADFWSRLATAFRSNARVIFALVNEPHDMSTEQWVGAANAAITAIRAAGATQLILVPGNGYTGAHSWSQSWYGTSNATAMLQIRDSGNNYAFEVHQYLDGDFSGTSANCQNNTIGATALQGFTNWLRTQGKRGFLGEFGGGANGTCTAAIDGMLQHIEANSSVWLGWTWWAGGPWWGNYFFSLEPNGSTDKPQMDALEPHLAWTGSTGGNGGGGGGATCSVATTTYEAESMTHSTGGAAADGWNIWSNGFISTARNFTAGPTKITVTARGTLANGAGPHMVVTVGGVRVGEAIVSSTGFTQFPFTFTAAAGTAEVRVTFDNDSFANGEDRNLIVDKLSVSCP